MKKRYIFVIAAVCVLAALVFITPTVNAKNGTTYAFPGFEYLGNTNMAGRNGSVYWYRDSNDILYYQYTGTVSTGDLRPYVDAATGLPVLASKYAVK